MKVTKIQSASVRDGKLHPVTVEVAVSDGIGIHIVGLADESIKTSLLRIVTALQYSGYRLPAKKIVVNIAPADLRKSGTAFDLPIAIGLLHATGQLGYDPGDVLYYGELAIDGRIREAGGEAEVFDFVRRNNGLVACAESACRREALRRALLGAESLKELISYAEVCFDGPCCL